MPEFGVAAESASAPRLPRVPWGAVITFVLLACLLAWAVAMPLWLIDSEQPGYQALFSGLASAMMFTPAVATLVVVFLFKVPRAGRARFLGMWPLRPAKRVVWFTVAALGTPLVLVIACIGVAALCGWITLDLVHFSAFRELIDQQLDALGPEAAALAESSLPPIGLLVVFQLLAIPVGALVNSVFAFGEEIGWRGWLLPALRPLGVWPALLLSGAIWGFWHAPVILLGYNFNRTDWTGVALMMVGCVAWGVLFGWARLRTGSVWPAVVGHGALNASAGLFLMVGTAGAEIDPALVSPLGLAGWIVIAIVVLILWLTGQFKREPELAPRRVRSYAPDVPDVQAQGPKAGAQGPEQVSKLDQRA